MGAKASKLDLEFEDEEEIRAREEKKRKKEVVEDVDLEFDVGEGEKSSVESSAPSNDSDQAPKAPISSPDKRAQREARAQTQTRNLKEVGPAPKAQKENSNVRDFPQHSSSQSSPRENYRLGQELDEALKSSRVLQVEMQAQIKIAVMEAKMEFLAKQAGEAKLLEHKVGNLINQMHKKAPSLKNELLSLKKLLSEHCKIRTKDEEEEKKKIAS